MSRRKCASLSRSNASLDIPMNSSTEMSSRMIGAAHANLAPPSAVVFSCWRAGFRSERGCRRKPVSGIKNMQPIPHATVTTPPAITPARSDQTPSATCRQSPTTAPM